MSCYGPDYTPECLHVIIFTFMHHNISGERRSIREMGGKGVFEAQEK